MKVIRKDAAVANTDEEFPGSFEVVLSAPTKDRDGETLLPEEWKQPLPSRITFDVDHGMNVKSTIGSGVPSIDDQGRLIVSGTYSSLPQAQEVRTLVKEGHIDRTSVAFMTEPSETKDGKKTVVRELLNGAFVAIPSNREAVVLSSKAAVPTPLEVAATIAAKAGARNSASDAEHIQAIHDHALALGATPAGKAAAPAETKATDGEDVADPAELAQAIDAALDEATTILDAVDVSTLPAEVQQAIALVQAADVASDELLDALGVPDPDEDSEGAPASDATELAPAKAAPTPVVVAPDEADALTLRLRSLAATVAGYTSGDSE